jgi:2,4-dienoyl-CoA reductase (NADPH2)
MAALGVGQIVDIVVTGVRGSTVDLLHHPTGRTLSRAVDWVVCAVHPRPSDELWRALDSARFPVYRVGDCLAPRRAHAAVIEGHRAAVAL